MLSTMYSVTPNAAIPTQYQLAKEQKNTSSVLMTSNTHINLASVALATGVWMIHGVAVFVPGSGVNTVGAAISATSGTIDDYSQYTQTVANRNAQFVTLPVKYYNTNVANQTQLVVSRVQIKICIA